MSIIKIHTDGACSGNQNANNVGGWGAVLEYGHHIKEIYGGEVNTTNNRMEMKALLKALECLKKTNLDIYVFSDSSYLMNCFREKWYEKWLINNWTTSGKTPVENRDLWEQLISHIHKHNISFFRIKGHLNLNHPNTDSNKWYEKFKEWNGNHFSHSEFLETVKMNHRADDLANMGILENKGNKSSQ